MGAASNHHLLEKESVLVLWCVTLLGLLIDFGKPVFMTSYTIFTMHVMLMIHTFYNDALPLFMMFYRR